jgi:pimeloyl-ACP methyl ester carboxylesterase
VLGAGTAKTVGVQIREQRSAIGEIEIFWREAQWPDGSVPVLYVHGSPSNSDDWLPFLERTGGLAPDLPGFGRSDKPANFPYTIEGFSDVLGAFLAQRGVDRYSLVVHDWGGAALGLAQRAPERVQKLVIINSVPLLPGYHWHTLARIWRAPLAGELFMGTSSRWAARRLLKPGTTDPDALIDSIWDHFDHGTQRAILKLYRGAPPTVLAHAGERLGEIRSPALVVWGEDDIYIPASFAKRYADALGGDTRVEILPGARHWPWIDDPNVIDTVAEFLAH